MWRSFKKFICCGGKNDVYEPTPKQKPAPKRVDSRIIHNARKNETLADDAVISWDDTVPFVPPFQMGIVIKVYDGDTLTIASKLPIPNSPLYRISVRLNGIDCPEMKSKNKDEHEHALLAKQLVESMVLNRVVCLENVKTEKYGRLLADVYTPERVHLNTLLVQRRLAVEYKGDTKQVVDWKTYHNSEPSAPTPVPDKNKSNRKQQKGREHL